MNRKLCIDEIDLTNKRILMRMDFDVPMTNGIISKLQKIQAAIPIIKLALRGRAKSIVLISHLGRPNGRKEEEYSLKPVAIALSKLLNFPVTFLPDCIGEYIEDAIRVSSDGSIFLLENLRFYLEEEGEVLNESGNKINADPSIVNSFCKCLTKLGDIYVNDSFSTSNKAHASMVGINLPLRVSGLQIKKELKYFNIALKNPQRPFLAILGGIKLKEKIPLIYSLLDKIDDLIITGSMAFTFLKQLHNTEIGSSPFDFEASLVVLNIMRKASNNNVNIHLPVDFIMAKEFTPDATTSYGTIENGIPNGLMGLDIGSKTITECCQIIERAKTIVWNGPMGVYEYDKFAKGTLYCMKEIVKATTKGAVTIIGGGDTATCCAKFNMEHLFSHVSTGDDASLDMLQGKNLPGLSFLNDYNPRLDEGWKLAEAVKKFDETAAGVVPIKIASNDDDADGVKFICPYREHKCPCSEVPEHETDRSCTYPLNCPCPGMQDPLDTMAKGCNATDTLCKTMKCPLCCEKITCRKVTEKKCHPCIPKSDLAYRYNLYPEKSVVCTTNIKPSDHPHNMDFFNCFQCQGYFNRNIPFVNNTHCKGNPCYCYKIEYPDNDLGCFSCVPLTGLCCTEAPFTILN